MRTFIQRLKTEIKDFLHLLHRAYVHHTERWEARILGWHLPPIAGILIILAGVVFLLGGIAMLVLPGQGILTIALGIAVMRIGVRVVCADKKTEVRETAPELPPVSLEKKQMPEPAQKP